VKAIPPAAVVLTLMVADLVQGEHEAVRSEMEKEAMRAAKLESRLAVLTKGYVTREAALRKEVEDSWQAVQTADQVRSFANLADLHTAAKVID